MSRKSSNHTRKEYEKYIPYSESSKEARKFGDRVMEKVVFEFIMKDVDIQSPKKGSRKHNLWIIEE